jgi:DNA-binding response OmpR family regulator/DNA-binding CsgD family transcriptional regulator
MAALILIVDDDADTRDMLRAAIAGAGMQPILAQDGAAALEVLRETAPDLILLDAVMPDPDGFETCARIKAIPEVSHIPVMFMTGLTDTEHVVRGLNGGCVDYVTKPVNLDELIARVRVHLGNAHLTRSALNALDTAGRRLIAADEAGAIRWMTPEASRALTELGAADDMVLSPVLVRLIQEARRAPDGDLPKATLSLGGFRIVISYLGEASVGEHLFRVAPNIEGMEASILQNALALTPREADVLLWISRGKSNRDASEILNISARTVNKHLEQVFIKLGVENRAAAAAIATRALFNHG